MRKRRIKREQAEADKEKTQSHSQSSKSKVLDTRTKKKLRKRKEKEKRKIRITEGSYRQNIKGRFDNTYLNVKILIMKKVETIYMTRQHRT